MTDATSFWGSYKVAFAVDGDDGVELILAPTATGDSNLVLRLTAEGVNGWLRPADDPGQAADQAVDLPTEIPDDVWDALMAAQPALEEETAFGAW